MGANKHGGSLVDIDSQALKALIEEQELSLTAVAEMVESNASTISRIISRGNCRQEMLYDLALVLEVSCRDLMRNKKETRLSAPEFCRVAAGLSIDELSKKAGVNRHSIARLEAGEGDVLSFNAYCLAKACGVPTGVYLGYE